MAKVQRSTDLIEMIAEKAFFYALGGLLLASAGGVLLKFRGDGMFVALGSLLVLFGAGLIVAAIYGATQVRKVTSVLVTCPLCQAQNALLETPDQDFACVECHRMIPIQDGAVMPVSQVQCGFCKELNYYCDKTEVLICESCDHEIPINQEEGKATKVLPRGFAITEDDSLYELVLSESGNNKEELINALQHMLALNRNQVKDLLNQLPSTLLTGINRRKAEMLQAQLSIHGGHADIRELAL